MYAAGKMITRNRNTRGRLSRLSNATHETQVSAQIGAAPCLAGIRPWQEIEKDHSALVRVVLL